MKYLKYIPWILVIICLIVVSIYQWRAAVSARELASVRNQQLMQANLELGKANTKIVEQDKLHKIALSEIDSKWKEEIKKYKAMVVAYGELEAKYQVEKKNEKIKVVYRDQPGTIIDLPKNMLFIRKEDGEYIKVTSIAWSYEDFRIKIDGDTIKETISYNLHQSFKGQLVQTVLPSGGKNYYFKLYEVDNTGKKVADLTLEKFDVLTINELPEKMLWWNPKLDLQVGAGTNHKLDFNWLADIGISISAYGKTPDDLRMRFFRVGAGLTNNGFSLSFSPVIYNVAKHLPLLSNLWLGPYAGYDFGIMTEQFGLGMSLVF
jgi:hypothetical protein